MHAASVVRFLVQSDTTWSPGGNPLIDRLDEGGSLRMPVFKLTNSNNCPQFRG